MVVAARATGKEINKYPGRKNIVLVYRIIIIIIIIIIMIIIIIIYVYV